MIARSALWGLMFTASLALLAPAPCQAQANGFAIDTHFSVDDNHINFDINWGKPDDPPNLDGLPDLPFPDPFDELPDPIDFPDFPPDEEFPLPPDPDLPDPWGDFDDFPSLFPPFGDEIGHSPIQFKPEPLMLPFYPLFGPDVQSTSTGRPACTTDQDTRLIFPSARVGKLIVVGTCTPRVLAKVPVGALPSAAKANPAGDMVLVSNSSGRSVTLIELQNYTVVATIPLPPIDGQPVTPAAIAFSPDGSKAYIANHSDLTGSPAVQVLDMNSRTVTGVMRVGAFPAALAVTPDGSELWVTCRGDSTVYIFDTLTNATIGFLNNTARNPLGIAFNPTGTRAYIASAPVGVPGTLEVLDTTTYNRVASIPVGTVPGAVIVSPTGRFVLVSNLNSPFVSQIDALNNVVVRNRTVKAPWRLMFERR